MLLQSTGIQLIERYKSLVGNTPFKEYSFKIWSLSIDYIGSVDRQLPFIYYTSATAFRYHKYRKRGKNRPYVWIDTTPNENGMYDCFIFNAPLLNTVSISAIFKDLR